MKVFIVLNNGEVIRKFVTPPNLPGPVITCKDRETDLKINYFGLIVFPLINLKCHSRLKNISKKEKFREIA